MERQTKNWVIPIICFSAFVITLIVIMCSVYGKFSLLNEDNTSQDAQQHVTSMQDFQKAINSSLK